MGEDVETIYMTIGNMQHEARRGFEEITKRNIWGLKENMDIKDIREALFEDVPQLIERVFDKYRDLDLIDTQQHSLMCENLKENLQLESCIMALKVYKILRWTDRTGLEIVDMLFPASLIEFSLENQELNLRGKVDKIELLDGYYYPIEIKSGKPPLKGVWKSDALQIAAYAILIEEEFKKEVPVGFVDYLQIGDRITVPLNNPLREELFTVLNEINSILDGNCVPEIVQNPNKCRACDYADFCEYCND